MFSKKKMNNCTENFSDKIGKLREALNQADAVIIGAGAGLSTSAGFSYDGERFHKYFGDLAEKYGIQDIYSGGFYPFESLEEYWAWWSRHIYLNRYIDAPGEAYSDLLKLVSGRNYFVITTNVDHQFQKAGFDKERLFYTQGDYGLLQCSKPCHHVTYDNEGQIRKMYFSQRDMKVSSEDIPYCPVCGSPMVPNLRADNSFVEDDGWHEAAARYNEFIKQYGSGKVLFLELGVGENTPVIIKYPFRRMTVDNINATYASINLNDTTCPEVIMSRAIMIREDIDRALTRLILENR